MIRLKNILLEEMTPDVADIVFAKFGVENASSLDKGQLKKYYIALVKQHHPDAGGKTKNMQHINAAYEVLKDAEPPDTSGPADLWGGRTAPKNPKTKGALKRINLEFRMEADDSVIAHGIGDYFDVLKIVQGIKNMHADASFYPLVPTDENGQWITDNVIVYIETPYLDSIKRERVKQATRLLVRKYCSTTKSA